MRLFVEKLRWRHAVCLVLMGLSLEVYAFSPSDLGGLTFWVRADTGVESAPGIPATNGDAVAVWTDASTNSLELTQVSVGQRPALSTNAFSGRPAVVFADGNFLSSSPTPMIDPAQGQTVVAVLYGAMPPNAPVMGWGETASTGSMHITASEYVISGDGLGSLTGPGTAEVRVVVGTFDGTNLAVYFNGRLAETGRAVHVAGFTNVLTAGSALFHGPLAEAAVFDRLLPTGELAQLNRYLLTQYVGQVVFSSIVIPDGHTILDPFQPSLDAWTVEASTSLTLVLHYRTNQFSAFTSTTLTNDYGAHFTGGLLALGSATSYQFYIQADYAGSGSGVSVWPADGSNAPITVARALASNRQQGPSTRRSQFSISEIMYHPRDYADGLGREFVEIFNSEPVAVDIGGYRLSGDIDYTFPVGTMIQGMERIVVAGNRGDFAQLHPSGRVFGPFAGELLNAGGLIRFRSAHDAVLTEVEYQDEEPWPFGTDGEGHSLVLNAPDFGTDDPRAWSRSATFGGSPGGAEPFLSAGLTNIVINEILAHTDDPLFDYIELFNAGTQAVDLSGCFLTDNAATNLFMIPSGTVMNARSYLAFHTNNAALGFELAEGGEEILLVAPDGERIVDGFQFEAQRNGVAYGRYPDGTRGLSELVAPTLASTNAALRTPEVVIHEIMYHPISGDAGDEFIEIRNLSTAAVDVSSWQFSEGVRYTFPSNTWMSVGGYFVIGRDPTNLVAQYAQLNFTNTFGPFSGSLSDRGERLVLVQPEDPLIPASNLVVVDEVFYRDDEKWGEWTDAGGSSLELVDIRADNRLAANWAGSDETTKAPWTYVGITNILQLGTESGNELHMLLLDEGECLVDGVEVIRPGVGGNRVPNPSFESGLANWIIQGNHIGSVLVTNQGFHSNSCLRIRSSGKGDNGVNRIENNLTSTLFNNQQAIIAARVRWQAGCPDILLRLHGNWLEIQGKMTIHSNMGTPGLPNSKAITNAAPSITEALHAPTLPGANQAVVISARIADPDGIESVLLSHRADPSYAYQTNAMNDLGTNGDAVAGDGVYSASVPGLSANNALAFTIVARDLAGSASRFPVDAGNEGVILFGQADPGGEYGSYRFWMTASNITDWANRQALSDHPVAGTFVYGTHRTVYEGGARFRGSPFVRSSGDPRYLDTSYVLYVPPSERILGATGINMDRLERDDMKLRERTAFWMHDQLGQPLSHQRMIKLFMHEERKSTLYADVHQPSQQDYIDKWLDEENEGELYKIDDWFEFNDNSQIGHSFQSNARLEAYYNNTGSLHATRYRWSWGFQGDRYPVVTTNRLLELVAAINLTPNTAQYESALQGVMDVEQFVGVIALRHALGDWDGYGYDRGKNSSAYKPSNGRWRLLPWDLDMALGSWSDPSDPLLSIEDPAIYNKLLAHWNFKRIYWQWICRAVYGPFESAAANPPIDRIYAAYQADGLGTASTSDLKTWIASRRTFLLAQLSAQGGTFQIDSNGGADFSTDQPVVTLQGSAPVTIDAFTVNGLPVEPFFTSLHNWEVPIELRPGTNLITVQGSGCSGAVGTDSITITLTSQGVSPAGFLVLNEIMYNALEVGGDFIEIHNTSADTTFHVGGMELQGAGFWFAQGTLIQPGGFLVVVENPAAFISRWGNGIPVAGQFTGSLDNGGERLQLVIPAGISGSAVEVDSVRYDDTFPWSTNADGFGTSLQLRDPFQDNDQGVNWGVDTVVKATPGATNSIRSSLGSLPSLRINEVQPRNLNTMSDNFGDFDPWIELYGKSVTNVIAVEIHQASNHEDDLRFELEIGSPVGAVAYTNELISTSALWRYLDDGSDQGTAWRDIVFNHSGWSTGFGRFGYGDPANTTLSYGPDSNDRHMTYYFRQVFTVTNAASYSNLQLYFQRDDGLVIYLNGTEIERNNMPGGLIDFETPAASVIGFEDETNWQSAVVSASQLVEGSNVVAVELHQSGPTSSDLGFHFRMTASGGSSSGLSAFVSTASTWRYKDNGSWPDGDWTDDDYDDSGWNSGSGAFGFGYGGEGTALYTGAVAYFFRKSFVITNAISADPTINLRADDGAVVYLNDVEIFRYNMPDGATTNSTTAFSPVVGQAGTALVTRVLSRNLFRAGSVGQSLNDIYLTDTANNLGKWRFPTGHTAGAGGYVLVWSDSETNEAVGTNFHANFTLSQTGGLVALVWGQGTNRFVLDHVYYGVVGPGQSYGRDRSGGGDFLLLAYPTPGGLNDLSEPLFSIRINEYMADNKLTISNGLQIAEDWIELYNAGTSTVNLAGYGLTDDINLPGKWLVPTGVNLTAGGFLVVWASGNSGWISNQLHAAFKLAKDGEDLAVFDSDGVLVDWLDFGNQETDFSEGRYPDGGDPYIFMAVPTPGTTNRLLMSESIRLQSGQANITWPTRKDFKYDLYATPGPGVTNGWSILQTNLIGTGTVRSADLPVDDPSGQKSFRILQKR